MVVRNGGIGVIPWLVTLHCAPQEGVGLRVEIVLTAESRSEAIELGEARATRLGYTPLYSEARPDSSNTMNLLRITAVTDGMQGAASAVRPQAHTTPPPPAPPENFPKAYFTIYNKHASVVAGGSDI